jgi:hypothetical protein
LASKGEIRQKAAFEWIRLFLEVERQKKGYIGIISGLKLIKNFKKNLIIHTL